MSRQLLRGLQADLKKMLHLNAWAHNAGGDRTEPQLTRLHVRYPAPHRAHRAGEEGEGEEGHKADQEGQVDGFNLRAGARRLTSP